MTLKRFTLLITVLSVYFINAQTQDLSHMQMELITGFEFPDTKDIFGEVLEKHYKVNEMFDEFVPEKKANKVILYEYNNMGNLSIIRYYASEDLFDQRKPNYQFVFEYGPNNQLTRFYNQGPPNIEKVMTTVQYDGFGRVSGIKKFGNEKGKANYGKELSSLLVQYDSIGNIASSRELIAGKNGQRGIQTNYSYQPDQSLLSRLVYEASPSGGLILVAKDKYEFINNNKRSHISYKNVIPDNVETVKKSIEGLVEQSNLSFDYSPNNKNWVKQSIYVNEPVNVGYSIKKPSAIVRRSYLSPEARTKKVKIFEENRQRIIQERKERELAEQTRQLNQQKRAQLSAVNESIDRLYIVKDFRVPTNAKAHNKPVKKHLYNAYNEIYEAKKDDKAFYDRLLYIQNSMLQLFDKKTKSLEKSLKKAESLDEKIAILLPKKPSEEQAKQASN